MLQRVLALFRRRERYDPVPHTPEVMARMLGRAQGATEELYRNGKLGASGQGAAAEDVWETSGAGWPD